MPVKFIETTPQQQQAQSSTGVRLVKNVGPNRGPMVLYKVPKKINFRRALTKAKNEVVGAITNAEEEVWVVRVYFWKEKGISTFGNRSALYNTYGCVKEFHSKIWIAKQMALIDGQQLNGVFYDLNDFVNVDENGVGVIATSFPKLKGTVYNVNVASFARGNVALYPH